LPAEVWRGNEVAPTLNVFDNTGESRATVVIAEPTAYKFDSLSSNSMKSSNPDSGCNEVTIAPTLDTWKPDPSLNQGGIAIVQEPILIDGTRVDDVRIYQSPVQTLAARMGTGGNNVPMVATDINSDKPIGFSHTQGLDAQPSETAFPTLRVGGAGHAVAYTSSSFASYQEGVGTLRANGGDLGGGSESLIVAPDIATTFKTLDMVVRRLTPIECERLMGWPDNHTLHRADGKQNSDTTRYKMCGNGVASPVAQWIAEHILDVDRTF
jgi:DNA (cytosine-5)-methyltransferase 1